MEFFLMDRMSWLFPSVGFAQFCLFFSHAKNEHTLAPDDTYDAPENGACALGGQPRGKKKKKRSSNVLQPTGLD